MIARALLAAVVAGLLAGLFMTAVQTWRVVPLIKIAETYENGDAETADGHDHGETRPADEAADHDHGASAALMGRLPGTILANLVLGAGFALALAGLSLVSGRDISVQNALGWGASAWLAVQLLPSLGLPPELPGFPYVDLGARQIWWMATVAFSATGLMLLAWGSAPWAKLGGLALILAPQIYGAPQFEDFEALVPAVIASDYAVEALASTLAFWLVVALLLGWFNDRMVGRTDG